LDRQQGDSRPLIIAVLAVVMVGLAVVVIITRREPPPTDGSGGIAAVIRAQDGIDLDLAVELPQGEPLGPNVIVYTRVEGAKWNLWAVQADGSASWSITTEVAVRAALPAISPDRRTIAYTSRDEQVWDLYLLDTDGTKKVRVARNLAADARATWSPDGTKLAFITELGNQRDVAVLDLRTSEVRRLTDDADEEGDPAWSPNGARIAFWRNNDLYTVPADGGVARPLIIDGAQLADPAWSPDGTRIAYAAKPANGSWSLWVANADGTDPRRLAAPAASTNGDEQDPAWSPDSTRIAFETKAEAQRDDPDTDDAEIYVVDADGTNPVRLTTSPGYDGHPAWTSGRG
jgi:Tol biopolymer transport system component